LTDPALQREAILTALERLLAWSEITRSPQLGRFLDYIVRRTLDGDEQSIKAYSIAVDVFGRAADFDPQADPIVRVQARRLRSLLDQYYRSAGVGEVMQIHLPVGRYIPDFEAMPDPGQIDAEPEPEPPSQRSPRQGSLPISWFILAVIALGLAMTAYGLKAWGPEANPSLANRGVLQRPSIAIVEFQNLAAGGGTPPQVAGLAVELVTDLEQFEEISVRYGGGGEANIAMTRGTPSDFVLTGIVRPDGDVMQYSAILTDSRTGIVVWNQTLAVSLAEAVLPSVLDAVSRSFALVLGSPRGPLHVAARQFLAAGTPLDGQANLYLCRVMFDLYREGGNASDADRATACFASLPEADRQSAMALAASAAVTAETLVVERGIGNAPADRLRAAATMLEAAISLDPISSFVWEQQARLHEARREMNMARSDFSSAIQLNPANVDALAAYARLLAFAGNLTGAEAMARDAVGSPNPPAWYLGVPTLLALRDGEFATAIDAAERYAEADRELGPILAIMAAQGSGDSAVVNRYLPQVLDVAAFRAQGVLPRLRERITDSDLMESIRSALVQAGVPPTALIRSF